MNVLGIYSRAFCGTTIAMRLLTCIPGTVGIGEAFRLLPPVARHRHCALCGMDRLCPVYTPQFLSKRFTHHDVYRQLSSHLGRDKILVSSDKDPIEYQLALGRRQMDAVILVRSPYAVVRSDLERSLRFKTPEASLQFWYERFSMAEKWCKEWTRRHVVVAFEALMRHPQDVVAAVADAFGLARPTVPEDLSSVRVHAIGGNGSAYTSDRLDATEKWRTTLSTPVQETIRNHSAMKLYDRLVAKSVVPL